ncbi:MAG: hypothetical protein U1U88_002316, partial [Lawsonella clevelandensis]
PRPLTWNSWCARTPALASLPAATHETLHAKRKGPFISTGIADTCYFGAKAEVCVFNSVPLRH